MNENTLVKLERVLRIGGYIWAGFGLTIVGLSNVILISEMDVSFWFIPINPRDNYLVSFLLLVPALMIIISVIINRKYLTNN